VAAARQAVSPALEGAREALEALETRGEELLAASAGQKGKKPKKSGAKQRKQARKKDARLAKQKAAAKPEPRRWPWLVAVLGVVAVVAVVLRRKKSNDDLWPAPTGDGPVPSYREDPVPSAPSESGKTVSAAQTSPGDATPPDSDLGSQPQQSATNPDAPVTPGSATGGTSGPSDDALSAPTAGPSGATEGPGGEPPASDATNTTDSPLGEAGTPLANRGQEPLNPQDPS
jgi:cytoskeletal protein RodZ